MAASRSAAFEETGDALKLKAGLAASAANDGSEPIPPSFCFADICSMLAIYAVRLAYVAHGTMALCLSNDLLDDVHLFENESFYVLGSGLIANR